jgi:EmrB/QacA subfamily drug resistance transporter
MQPCDPGVIASIAKSVPCPAGNRRWILFATILGSSLAFIDGTVVNVALPALQTNLHATVVDVQWVVESYSLLLASLLLVGGSLGDIYGRKRVFLIGIIVFAVTSCICGLALNINQLILARSLQGIGAALLVPGSLAIISASFEERERGRAIGTWSGFTAITTAIGPVLGGWMIEHFSWRSAFFINLPVAAVVVAVTIWRVPESRNPQLPTTPDWWGSFLAVIGFGAVIFALIESAKRTWSDPYVIVALLAGVLALIVFVINEKHIAAPLLPLELFRAKNFAGANLLTLFLYSALSAMFFFFPMNLIQVQHYSATAAGASVAPFIVLMFLMSRWSGTLLDRYGSRLPLVVGPTISAAGLAFFAMPGINSNYWTSFFPAVMVLGVGMAISVAPLTTTVMNSVGESRAGIASGINNAVSRIAGVLSIAVFGIVMLGTFDRHLSRDLTAIRIAPEIRQEIDSQRIKLAATEIPRQLNAETQLKVRRSIDESFVAGFRMVMWWASGLALMSAASAFLWIGNKSRQQ